MVKLTLNKEQLTNALDEINIAEKNGFGGIKAVIKLKHIGDLVEVDFEDHNENHNINITECVYIGNIEYRHVDLLTECGVQDYLLYTFMKVNSNNTISKRIRHYTKQPKIIKLIQRNINQIYEL